MMLSISSNVLLRVFRWMFRLVFRSMMFSISLNDAIPNVRPSQWSFRDRAEIFEHRVNIPLLYWTPIHDGPGAILCNLSSLKHFTALSDFPKFLWFHKILSLFWAFSTRAFQWESVFTSPWLGENSKYRHNNHAPFIIKLYSKLYVKLYIKL